MTKPRRTFSAEFKREAADLVLKQNYNFIEASRSLGIGETALRRWVGQLQQERTGVIPQSKALQHVLVFSDDQTAFGKLGQPTAYIPDSGMVADEPVIKRFAVRLETRTNCIGRSDYDFEKPRLLMEAAVKDATAHTQPAPDLEDYDYPGHFVDRARGKHLSQRALERHRADYQLAEGRSDQPTLCSGHLLEVSEHPRHEWNSLWLLTRVQHAGKQPQVLEESITDQTAPSPLRGESWGEGHSDFHQGYRNHFTATPWDVPYRPALTHRKPQVLGSQTAVVTGPKGEEIHCDQYGRVKVQFHWDREGQGDDHSSCWLRVSNSWAGDLYGGIAIPRVGMEVLVTFLESDPDQPLVTGCLYHKEHVVPYDLPANKTRSVFKTLSSPGGGGYNEVRKLAGRTSEATEEIVNVVQQNQALAEQAMQEMFSSREQAEQGLALANQAGTVIVEIQEGAKQVVGAVGRFANELQ